MLAWCCPRQPVGPAPPPPLAPDLVADLPPHTRDSSAFTSFEEKVAEKKSLSESNESKEGIIVGDTTQISLSGDLNDPPPPRSPSIRLEDYSEKSNHSFKSNGEILDRPPSIKSTADDFGSQKSINSNILDAETSRPQSRRSSVGQTKSRSTSHSPAKSRNQTPDPTSDVYEGVPSPCERDVRNALAECIVPPRHEDWEIIVNGLLECERLATDPTARAPAASWRAAARSSAAHVRSLRSRVARTACSTLGTLFEYRGRALDTELEEAATALLDRCADVNRFLRADAANALVRLACGSNNARAAVALARRGSTHRAGPVRAAAAQALSKLVQFHGPSKTLDMPADPRTVLLRALGELLGDAHADTRAHARTLCLSLAKDIRFRPMLKDAMLPSRYRAIEKCIDKIR